MRLYQRIFILLCILVILLFSGCTTLPLEKIEVAYDYIQSYPGGGGIFPLAFTSSETLVDNITIDIKCDPLLNAELNQETLTKNSSVGAIIIKPSDTIPKGLYQIILTSPEDNFFKARILEVEIFNISDQGPSTYIQEKKDEMINWITTTHPIYQNLSNQTWYAYKTYANILVVEHWTFLSTEYELRICCHMTHSPNNWSKMMLRSVDNITPVLAAHQEYNGTCNEIHVAEYPTFYGY